MPRGVSSCVRTTLETMQAFIVAVRCARYGSRSGKRSGQHIVLICQSHCSHEPDQSPMG